MNAFFSALAKQWMDAATRRGATIASPDLDPAVAEELLQLTRVVAHNKERSFAPLSSYMAGVASERLRQAKGSADPSTLVAYIREVREALEREANS